MMTAEMEAKIRWFLTTTGRYNDSKEKREWMRALMEEIDRLRKLSRTEGEE